MHIQLFNVGNDLGERRNLATDMPEKASELPRQLHHWRKSLNAAMPTPNPAYRAPAAAPRPETSKEFKAFSQVAHSQ